MRIKIININTWWGGRYLWDNLTQYLKSEQADIVMMQEACVNSGSGLLQYLTTAASLKKMLDYPYAEQQLQYGEKVGQETLSLANAMLSRFPLINKSVVWLQGNGPGAIDNANPASFPDAPRNLLHCQMDINDQLYNLITLQGVWAPDSNVTDGQLAQGKVPADYIKDKPNIILSGDFNVKEGSQPISLIEQYLTNIFVGERKSSFNMKHKTNPGYATAVVDFVFTSPDLKVTDHYTADADVSDHQSQVVILDL